MAYAAVHVALVTVIISSHEDVVTVIISAHVDVVNTIAILHLRQLRSLQYQAFTR